MIKSTKNKQITAKNGNKITTNSSCLLNVGFSHLNPFLDYCELEVHGAGAPIGSFREYVCSEGLKSPEIFGFKCRES